MLFDISIIAAQKKGLWFWSIGSRWSFGMKGLAKLKRIWIENTLKCHWINDKQMLTVSVLSNLQWVIGKHDSQLDDAFHKLIWKN